MKFKDWNGKDLDGIWIITKKIDGIQGRKIQDLRTHEGDFINSLVSKNNKYLNNLPKKLPTGTIFEIYNGNCHDTWSVLSGPEGERTRITPSQIYQLYPVIDPRLVIVKVVNPSTKIINYHFKKVLKRGGEGLVLRRVDKDEQFIKVKESYTKDSKIVAIVEGKGKLKGKLGKFITENGGVGIGKGLTHKRREELYLQKDELINTFIEVKCMHMTKNDKFFQPRFVRLRPDK